MTTRRTFLTGLVAATLPQISWSDVGSPACLAAGKEGASFVLHGLSSSGESLFQILLPGRGHAAAAHPTKAVAVAFARRPGTFALVINCANGATLQKLELPNDRRFNGHGAFSPDGGLLMTSEVVAETSEGRIGLWNTSRYERVGEWPSGGIGPHEIKLFQGGRLVVANGGIATDPSDRAKLNLPDMRPNLCLLSLEGKLLDRVELPKELRQNSIRHLALLKGKVAFAMQWEGDVAETVPPLGLWTPGSDPIPCPTLPDDAFAMKGYAGSIAANGVSGQIAVTSAPGGCVMIFDAEGHPVAKHLRQDISGIATGPNGFLATDGFGTVWTCDAHSIEPLSRNATAWDNHLVAIS